MPLRHSPAASIATPLRQASQPGPVRFAPAACGFLPHTTHKRLKLQILSHASQNFDASASEPSNSQASPARPTATDTTPLPEDPAAPSSSHPPGGSYSEFSNAVNAVHQSSSSQPSTSNPPAANAAGAPQGQGSDGTNPRSSVEEALQQAERALSTAETELAAMKFEDDGRGAWLRNPRLLAVFNTVRTLVALGALCVFMVASHAFGLLWQWAAALVGAMGIAGEVLVSVRLALLFIEEQRQRHLRRG